MSELLGCDGCSESECVCFTPYLALLCSVAKSCWALCDPMDCSTPGFLVLHYLPEFAQIISIKLMIPSNHLILCHLIHLLPTLFPRMRFFSNESALCIRWQKYWSFSFITSPSDEYSRLISFRIDWFVFLAVQGTLKSTKKNFF